jgi:hypothetical protein
LVPDAPPGDSSNRAANTRWVQQNAGGGGGGAVNSVFGRTGTVVATVGDYSFPQISGLLNLNQMPGILPDNLYGNIGSGPAGIPILNCAGVNQALIYSTATHAFSCNTLVAPPAQLFLGATPITGGPDGVLADVSGVLQSLSNAQITARCMLFGATTSGCVPSTAPDPSKFLRADGNWVAPTAPAQPLIIGSTPIQGGGAGRILYDNGSVLQEIPPTPGGTSAYLRADFAWEIPPGGGTGAPPGGATGSVQFNAGGGSFNGVALSADQIVGALAAATPVALAVPSCSGSTNALTWTTGTGFGCNTIAGGGTAAGPLNSVQFNNPLGTFAGSANLTWTSASNQLTSGGAPVTSFDGATSKFQAIITSGAWAFSGVRYSADVSGPTIGLGKSRNATPGSFTALGLNDVIGTILFYGSSDTAFYNTAGIQVQAAETYSATTGGSWMRFLTTPIGSVAEDIAMYIQPSGGVSIGAPFQDNGIGTLALSKNAANILPGSNYNWGDVLLHITPPDGRSGVVLAESFNGGGFYYFGRTAGGTAAAPTAATGGDMVGLWGDAFDGTAYSGGTGGINIAVAGPFSASSHPTMIGFYVTAPGAGASQEAMRILPSGTVGIGTPYVNDYGVGGLVLSSPATFRPVHALANRTNDNSSPQILFQKQREGGANNGAVASGDFLGMLWFEGTDSSGAQQQPGVRISANASQAWTSTAHGALLEIITTPNGSTTNVISARFQASGGVSIGTPFTDPGTGSLIVNRSGSPPQAAYPTVTAHFLGVAGSNSMLNVDAFAGSSYFMGRRFNGTPAAVTGILAGDTVAVFGGEGQASTGGIPAPYPANMAIVAAENFTSTAAGTMIDFYTTPLGSLTATLRMRIQPSGGLSIGGSFTDPGAGGIAASGPITISGTAVSRTIASGFFILNTTTVPASSCTAVQSASVPGVTANDAIAASFYIDPTSTPGYVPGAMLTIIPFPTANTVNMRVCNNTGASITPTSNMGINWVVVR